MIGSLSGYVTGYIGGVATVVVNGVGYEVAALDVAEQSEVYLHVHTYVTDDAISLYGFHSHELRARFRSLIALDGIGPKAALKLCSLSDDAFARALKSSDRKFFTAVDGIGPKTAERIIESLR